MGYFLNNLKTMRFFIIFDGPNIRCFCGRISPPEFLLVEGFRRIPGLVCRSVSNLVKMCFKRINYDQYKYEKAHNAIGIVQNKCILQYFNI